MLDSTTTKQRFQQLTKEQKYDELLKIFESIKEKNDNCRYIYEKLTTKKELFDDALMIQVFDDVMHVYERVVHENKEANSILLDKSVSLLEKLHEKEANERVQESQECEELLQF